MRVLVTGASGFVGRALCTQLEERGFEVRTAVRRRDATAQDDVVEVGDIRETPNWATALRGCDAVVHLAAMVHDRRPAAGVSRRLYFAVNAQATERLARAAASAGVRRFVFLSTIKVLGDSSGTHPLDESDAPQPRGPYAESKWAAERALMAINRTGALEVAVLRPPLVYGAGVRANFLRLMEWIDRGWPLPLGSVRNRRSLLYVENLASGIIACIRHPGAGGGTFMIDDGEPVSTPALIRALAQALGRAPRLVPCPVAFLRVLAIGAGRRALFERLCGNFEVSSGRLRAALGWTPPWSPETGLRATVAAYRAHE